MKVKIRIETPDGQASGTLSKLKHFLKLGAKVKIEAYANKEERDNMMFIEVEGEPRHVCSVIRNVALYEKIPQLVLDNAILKAGIGKLGASDKDIAALKKMMTEGTKISIVKEATAQEMMEDNKTLWQRIKEKFQRLQ